MVKKKVYRSIDKKNIMSVFDPTVIGQIAGPAGYLVAKAAGDDNFTADADSEPMALKLFKDATCMVKQCFAAEGDEAAEVAGDAVDAAESAVETADGASVGGSAEDLVQDKGANTKKYSFWDWLVFGLTILAIITSWTLNNNVDVRAKLGYSGANATAGILISLLSIFAIFMFGPWMYFFFLLVPIWQKFVPVFNTPNGMYWMDGVKASVADPVVPVDNKFITKYLAMLPMAFESPKAAAVPAQFGQFYY